MIKSTTTTTVIPDAAHRKRVQRPLYKRAHSLCASTTRSKVPAKHIDTRRCHSVSPSMTKTKSQLEDTDVPRETLLLDEVQGQERCDSNEHPAGHEENTGTAEQNVILPQCVLAKLSRQLATKKREFMRMKKNIIGQQNILLAQYAALKELEHRVGVVTDSDLGDIRILAMNKWAPYDLLLLIRDDIRVPSDNDLKGVFAPQVLQQLHAQLVSIPDEMRALTGCLLERRLEVLTTMRSKHRNDRPPHVTNFEWKARNNELDVQTSSLEKMVAGTLENLKAKIAFTLELAKIPWVDREALIKKIERVQKENLVLQHKIEEAMKKDEERTAMSQLMRPPDTNEMILQELRKEREAHESLKEVVNTAEGMLRVARAKISTLEKQLKDARTDVEAARRKQKELEQIHRQRESSYDTRSKKLLEVSKTGEVTIEALSRQRDALELRVKELREQVKEAELQASMREAELRTYADSLHAKDVAMQLAEARVAEYESRMRAQEEQLNVMRERSIKLVELERRRCLDTLPGKEREPSDHEAYVWKELQLTRAKLLRVQDELRQSRADKENFLNSLSKIAGDEGGTVGDKMATELVEREQKISKLQQVIEKHQQNEKLMEQNKVEYEKQISELRMEVKRLRLYDCYSKEMPNEELQTELMDMHMKVDTLTRERNALASAAASRALMLERHERAAELFAQVTRTRRELSAVLNNSSEPEPADDFECAEVSRSLTSVCASAAEQWAALSTERARVLLLERAVFAQQLQLEREGCARTQLESRRAALEREHELIRGHYSHISSCVTAEHIVKGLSQMSTEV